MPAKWQRWMPMEIDALKASPAVQAMHPAARSGYVWLLLDAWQTDDCTIPSDPIDLADKSGLGDELWAAHGIRILRKFERLDGSDRLRNLAQYERWQAAKVVYEKKREAANRTNELRSPSDRHAVTDSKAPQSPSKSNSPFETPFTETETEKKTVKPKKPSRTESSKAPDNRHRECKEVIRAYWQLHNPDLEMPWDGSEGKVLGMFLRANPKLTAIGIRKLLNHRSCSEVNQCERPSKWVRNLTDYARGPIDRYGKPKSINGGKPNAPVPLGKAEGNLAVLAESLGLTEHQSPAHKNGNLPGREDRQANTRTIDGDFTSFRPSSLPSGDGDFSGKPKAGGGDGAPVPW